MDETKGRVLVAKASNSEVDSKDIAGAEVHKKMAKAPKKRSVPRKALSKKREEDLAKQVTNRKTWKKIVMPKTIAPEPDKLATALESVQLDNEGTTMQSMMLTRRKTTHDNAEMMEKKRKTAISNDLEEETELKEDLEYL